MTIFVEELITEFPIITFPLPNLHLGEIILFGCIKFIGVAALFEFIKFK